VADRFTYSGRTGRYRDNRTGRFVREQAVREAVDRVADLTSERLADLSRRLIAGHVSLAEWQAQGAQAIKEAHLATAMAAHGGRARMTPADWGRVGQRLRTEYVYLDDFARQIAEARQPMNGRLVARARLYGQAARSTFRAVRDRDARLERGAYLERNVISSKEACAGCREQTRRGWSPLGTLVPPGQRQCRGNCRCRLAYREIGGGAGLTSPASAA
jgi:hypothetical protein